MYRLRRSRQLLAVLCLAAPALLGAAGPASAATAAPKYPNLIGTWEGDYRFASNDDQGVSSHEKLVIDHQDAELVWGHDEFVDTGNVTTRVPVRGSIDLDRRGFGLAEAGGLFTGKLTGKNAMTIRFFLVGTSYTSFNAKLKRTSSATS